MSFFNDPKSHWMMQAKLNEDGVREIRADLTSTHAELAKKFNVSKHTIKSVKNLKTWKHVK